jgi:hypothetical protein
LSVVYSPAGYENPFTLQGGKKKRPGGNRAARYLDGEGTEETTFTEPGTMSREPMGPRSTRKVHVGRVKRKGAPEDAFD